MRIQAFLVQQPISPLLVNAVFWTQFMLTSAQSLSVPGTLLLLTVVFNVAVWTSKPLETDVAGSTISALAPLPIGK